MKCKFRFLKNDGGHDVKDGSIDNTEKSMGTPTFDDPSKKQCKDEGEALTWGFSDDINLNNLISGNNEGWGGDTVLLTYGNISGTVTTDDVMMERTPKRRRKPHSVPTIEVIEPNGKIVQAGRGTGNIGLDDDENGGNSDGKKS